MTLFTEHDCLHLDSLDRVRAIRAIQSAWMRLREWLTLSRGGQPPDEVENLRTMQGLVDCLAEAGHSGFITPDPPPAILVARADAALVSLLAETLEKVLDASAAGAVPDDLRAEARAFAQGARRPPGSGAVAP